MLMVPRPVARVEVRPHRPFVVDRGSWHQHAGHGFSRSRSECPSHGSLKTEEKTERQCGQSFEGCGLAIPDGEAVCQFTMIEQSFVEQKQIVELVSTERIAVRHTRAIPPGGTAL